MKKDNCHIEDSNSYVMFNFLIITDNLPDIYIPIKWLYTDKSKIEEWVPELPDGKYYIQGNYMFDWNSPYQKQISDLLEGEKITDWIFNKVVKYSRNNYTIKDKNVKFVYYDNKIG